MVNPPSTRLSVRCVVTVAYGNRPDVGKPEGALIGTSFSAKLARWRASFDRHDDAGLIGWQDEWPPSSPPHLEKPYAFKAYALRAAWLMGYRTMLWTDVSVVALRPLAPLWELIERQGCWFSDNREWNCGQWTCDSALGPLGITREEAFAIPQVAGTAFGIDYQHELGRKFFEEYLRLAEGEAFCGPWVNDRGQASADPRVRGHRHDQTAASVLAYRLGIPLTHQPEWFSDYRGETETTILKVER